MLGKSIVVLGACAGLWLGELALADFTFTKLADQETKIPGQGGNVFTGFGQAPAINAGKVAFVGVNKDSAQGIYVATVGGGMQTLADAQTKIPGAGNDTFNAFIVHSTQFIKNGKVAFIGFGPSGPGVYTGAPGNLSKVIASGDADLDNKTFSSFSKLSLSGNQVGFLANSSDGRKGVYTNTAAPLAKVADSQTAIPGGAGNFLQFIDESFSNGKTALVMTDANLKRGIYSDVTGQLKKVVDTTDKIPGSDSTFDVLQSPSLDGSRLAFTNYRAGAPGIYLADIGATVTLSTVADPATAIPGGGGKKFVSLGEPALDGANVAFYGAGDPDPANDLILRQKGIYARYGGSLIKVVDLNTALPGAPDGYALSDFGVSREAISGNQVVFYAQFSKGEDDTRQALYVVAIPEPGSLGLLSAAACAILGRRRRRAQRSA